MNAVESGATDTKWRINGGAAVSFGQLLISVNYFPSGGDKITTSDRLLPDELIAGD